MEEATDTPFTPDTVAVEIPDAKEIKKPFAKKKLFLIIGLILLVFTVMALAAFFILSNQLVAEVALTRTELLVKNFFNSNLNNSNTELNDSLNITNFSNEDWIYLMQYYSKNIQNPTGDFSPEDIRYETMKDLCITNMESGAVRLNAFYLEGLYRLELCDFFDPLIKEIVEAKHVSLSAVHTGCPIGALLMISMNLQKNDILRILLDSINNPCITDIEFKYIEHIIPIDYPSLIALIDRASDCRRLSLLKQLVVLSQKHLEESKKIELILKLWSIWTRKSKEARISTDELKSFLEIVFAEFEATSKSALISACQAVTASEDDENNYLFIIQDECENILRLNQKKG